MHKRTSVEKTSESNFETNVFSRLAFDTFSVKNIFFYKHAIDDRDWKQVQ